MGRPKKVKAENPDAVEHDGGLATVVKSKVVVGQPKQRTESTEYTPIQELTPVEESALTPEEPSSPKNTLEGKEAPVIRNKKPETQRVKEPVQKFASEVQERVMARQKAKADDKAKRIVEVLAKAKSKKIDVVFVPYKDRNGEIVPALVLGVEDTFKKDKGGQVFDENNEPVMEAKLRVYVFSNIDEPRKVLYTFSEE